MHIAHLSTGILNGFDFRTNQMPYFPGQDAPINNLCKCPKEYYKNKNLDAFPKLSTVFPQNLANVPNQLQREVNMSAVPEDWEIFSTPTGIDTTYLGWINVYNYITKQIDFGSDPEVNNFSSGVSLPSGWVDGSPIPMGGDILIANLLPAGNWIPNPTTENVRLHFRDSVGDILPTSLACDLMYMPGQPSLCYIKAFGGVVPAGAVSVASLTGRIDLNIPPPTFDYYAILPPNNAIPLVQINFEYGINSDPANKVQKSIFSTGDRILLQSFPEATDPEQNGFAPLFTITSVVNMDVTNRPTYIFDRPSIILGVADRFVSNYTLGTEEQTTTIKLPNLANDNKLNASARKLIEQMNIAFLCAAGWRTNDVPMNATQLISNEGDNWNGYTYNELHTIRSLDYDPLQTAPTGADFAMIAALINMCLKSTYNTQAAYLKDVIDLVWTNSDPNLYFPRGYYVTNENDIYGQEFTQWVSTRGAPPALIVLEIVTK